MLINSSLKLNLKLNSREWGRLLRDSPVNVDERGMS